MAGSVHQAGRPREGNMREIPARRGPRIRGRARWTRASLVVGVVGMSSNPFEAPASPIEEGPLGSAVGPGEPLYFSVAPFKLVLMSVMTFGFYELYWFYRNFR